jgi:hypothetical protein
MKTTKSSTKKSAKGNGRKSAKSGIRGGVVKCSASKTASDGTTSTVEGTCDVGSAKACEEQLKKVLK